MVKNTPSFNSNLQERYRLYYDQESNMKSQKWDKLIANKKSVMKILPNRWDKNTRTEIALGSSYEDNLEAGELIKFLVRLRKVCNDTEDTDIFFGSWVTKITKHHVQPTTIVEQLLAAHPNNDAIWDNTNPCDVYLDNTSGTEALANVDVTKELIVTTRTSMSTKDDKIWCNAHEECYS
mmetsp:Transcript_3771/g.4076  ORF Transcript_3771/g.4076 Transcript_3771/m.4076 type:complete len:179 (+) Transcript_3771:294-830(+)